MPAPAASSRSILIVALCCLAGMGEGFDLQAPGVTLPVLGPLFHLATGEGEGFVAGFFSQKSLFLSMSTFGLMFGSMVGGRASDLVGRKWTAIVSICLFAALSVLTAHAASAGMLLAARFVTGLGLGAALPNLIALVTEGVGPGLRNTAVGFLYASMPLGGALVSLSSYGLATPEHWRAIYYLGGLVPILAALGLLFGAPDVRPQAAAGASPGVGFALFGQGRAATTLTLWLCFFCAMIIQYVLLGWLPSLLIAKGLSKPEASIVQLGFNVFGAAGGIVTGILIDRPSAMRSTAAVFSGCIVSLALLAAAPASLGVSFIVGSLVGFAIAGVLTIVYALGPRTYPGPVRGSGVGFAVAAGRVGSSVGPLLAGAMLGAGGSATRVLAVMAPLMIVSGLAALLVSRTAARADAFAGDVQPAAAQSVAP